MHNPISSLSKREWILWMGSLAVVAASNVAAGDLDVLTFLAALIGVTALILLQKETFGPRS